MKISDDQWAGILKGGSFGVPPEPPAGAVEADGADHWPFAYKPSDTQLDRITRSFTYHPPKADQIERYRQVRLAAEAAASLWVLHCPDSRELALAMTHLQQAVMWANAAIACNE